MDIQALIGGLSGTGKGVMHTMQNISPEAIFIFPRLNLLNLKFLVKFIEFKPLKEWEKKKIPTGSEAGHRKGLPPLMQVLMLVSISEFHGDHGEHLL